MAKFPPNPVAGTNTAITAISCASPGNCSAVGAVNGNATRGLLLTEKAGHWEAGVDAVLSANASSADFAEVQFNSISCASAGNCTAVGYYTTKSGGYSGLFLTETAGHWAPGVEAGPPALMINSVSCVSAGNCTAVGGGLVFTEKAGHWAKGVEPPLPPDAFGGAQLSSVSCSSAGSCSAAGTYNWTTGRDGQAGVGLLLTETRGKWRAVRAVMPPDGPGEGVILTSISCASAGNCGAFGLYNINIDGENSGEGVLLTERAGKWQPGVRAIPPKDAANSGYWAGYVGLSGISCTSPDDCVAAGGYYGAAGWQVTVVVEKAGKWRRGFEPAQPRNLHSDGGAVSCVSTGNCTVTASYGGRGLGQGFLFTETGGHWAGRVRAPFPADGVISISCASPGNCGAVGSDSRGDVVLLDGSTKPCVVPELTGKTVPDARRSLDSHGCSAGRIEHVRSRTVPRGRVISQTRQPGRRFAPWTEIRLEVSKGP